MRTQASRTSIPGHGALLRVEAVAEAIFSARSLRNGKRGTGDKTCRIIRLDGNPLLKRSQEFSKDQVWCASVTGHSERAHIFPMRRNPSH